MEIALALSAVAVLGWWLSRRRDRRRRELVETAGAFLAVVPVESSRREEYLQRDLEEGALDPDELADDPLHWGEGADDEVG